MTIFCNLVYACIHKICEKFVSCKRSISWLCQKVILFEDVCPMRMAMMPTTLAQTCVDGMTPPCRF